MITVSPHKLEDENIFLGYLGKLHFLFTKFSSSLNFSKKIIGICSANIWVNVFSKAFEFGICFFISRDRFGEKPLHYSYSKRNFYFASEIKFIKSLSNENYEINETLLLKFLILGYKALRKDTATFFKRIYEFPKSTYCVLDNSLKPNFIPYWSLFYRPKKISLSNAINKSKYFLAIRL